MNCVCVSVCTVNVLLKCKRISVDIKCVPVLIIVTDLSLSSFAAQFISWGGGVCLTSFANLQIVQPFEKERENKRRIILEKEKKKNVQKTHVVGCKPR